MIVAPGGGRWDFLEFTLATGELRPPNLGVHLVIFYTLVVLLGILSMGFQLLASRLLNPFFGSSLIVWAWLISTFLAAFSVGSILGGWISNAPTSQRVRAQWIAGAVAVGSLAFTAFFGRAVLGQIEIAFTEITTGLLVACLGLFFLPVTTLSSFGPQCVQFLAGRGTPPGKASGLVYGVSTLGNIAGVMLTAFVLIPHLPVSTLLYLWLGVALVNLSCLIILLRPDKPAFSP
ncbi:MAG: hypothetical protein B9S26_08155 [Opitutia bacterium Tous-C4FEB]|nr:MAG: hypothetical protein B9S26_08155 [Opitutae bacterium Tous-C4FEB]